MQRYIVNRSAGWPVWHDLYGRHKHQYGETFEENSADAEHAVTQGYLVRVEPEPSGEPFPEFPIVADPSADERPFTKEAKATPKK